MLPQPPHQFWRSGVAALSPNEAQAGEPRQPPHDAEKRPRAVDADVAFVYLKVERNERVWQRPGEQPSMEQPYTEAGVSCASAAPKRDAASMRGKEER